MLVLMAGKRGRRCPSEMGGEGALKRGGGARLSCCCPRLPKTRARGKGGDSGAGAVSSCFGSGRCRAAVWRVPVKPLA